MNAPLDASVRPQRIETIEALEAYYGKPSDRAVFKEIDHISDHYRAFIERAPFVAVASAGPEGLDCSPRGDPPGWVRVVDSKTIQMPDRRGNNRVDTLRNIVRDPRVGLLFLIPGVGETLRINGRASILIEPALLDSFAFGGKPPRSVISVAVDTVYFQCQKALARSRLWDPAAQAAKGELPTSGEILKALSPEPFDAESYDTGYSEYMKQTIY